MPKNNVFREIGKHLKDEPVLPFQESTPLSKKYLKTVKGKTIDSLFIGWICERDSFFAYLYKRMKKEAKEQKTTKIASEIARAGFPVMLHKINEWISRSQQILIVPVPSRHDISETFTKELYTMLDKDSKRISKVENLFDRLDMAMEIKKINSWPKRNEAVEKLFSLDKKLDLNQYSILLVDDIVTSGSSLRKCADLLKQKGVKKIAAVSLTTNLFDKFSYTSRI
jgi:predicted amidophosphoribosyltransferase